MFAPGINIRCGKRVERQRRGGEAPVLPEGRKRKRRMSTTRKRGQRRRMREALHVFYLLPSWKRRKPGWFKVMESG